MIRLKSLLALFCLSTAVPSFAADKPLVSARLAPPPSRKSEGVATAGDINFRIEALAKYQGLEGKARFAVGNDMHSNYVIGGDKAFPTRSGKGGGVEFKKQGFIINVLPHMPAKDAKRVNLQIQVELSGPTKGIQVDGTEVPDISTWQWQTEVAVPLGERVVLVDGPAYLELTIARADSDAASPAAAPRPH